MNSASPTLTLLFLIKLSNWNLIINATTCLTLGFPPACKAQFSRNFASAFSRTNAILCSSDLEQKSCLPPPATEYCVAGDFCSLHDYEWSGLTGLSGKLVIPALSFSWWGRREEVESWNEAFCIPSGILYFYTMTRLFVGIVKI